MPTLETMIVATESVEEGRRKAYALAARFVEEMADEFPYSSVTDPIEYMHVIARRLREKGK